MKIYTTLNEEVNRIKSLMGMNESNETSFPFSPHIVGNFDVGGWEILKPYDAGITLPDLRYKQENERALWGKLSTLISNIDGKKVFTLIDHSTYDHVKIGAHSTISGF